ncbi:MAG: c-type cytochrome [Candidatus Acidiferrum sp.]
MLRQFFLSATALAILPIAGCSYGHSDFAASGATPAVKVPIGPVPGGGPEIPGPTNPYANDPTALAKGRQLFVQYNCYGCHGGHAGGGMGPSLRDPDWIYGDSDAHVFESIAQGRSQGMPAWGTKLPSDQIWQLVAYVKSLHTSQEPDPPE